MTRLVHKIKKVKLKQKEAQPTLVLQIGRFSLKCEMYVKKPSRENKWHYSFIKSDQTYHKQRASICGEQDEFSRKPPVSGHAGGALE